MECYFPEKYKITVIKKTIFMKKSVYAFYLKIGEFGENEILLSPSQENQMTEMISKIIRDTMGRVPT